MTEEEQKLFADHFDPSDDMLGSGAGYYGGLNDPNLFEGGNAGSSAAPTTLNRPQQDDENSGSNRQRLLAYLGMGAQDAINGMTRFKGSTNAYDSIIRQADNSDKLQSIKRGQLVNYLKGKEATDTANRRVDLLEKSLTGKGTAADESRKLRGQEIDIKREALGLRAEDLDRKRDASADKPSQADVGASKKGIEEMRQWDLSGSNDAKSAIKNLDMAIKALEDNPGLAGSRMFSTMSNSKSEIVKATAKTMYPEQYALQRSITNDALPMLSQTLKGSISDADREYFLQSRIDLGLPADQVLAELRKASAKAKRALDTADGYYNDLRESGSVLGASRKRAQKNQEPQEPKAQTPPAGWSFKEIK